MLQFDDKFFEPEEREGFYVKSMMKRYWASTMEDLAEIDRICQKHGLRYFAFYGTLLGAVRHKGYIPWDDDMDIIMYRDDYEAFIKYAKEELRSPFIIYNNKESCLYPMRIVNAHYSSLQEDFLEQFHGCPYPSGVDIFVMDRTPTTDLEIQAVRHLHQVVRYVSQRVDKNFAILHSDKEQVGQEELTEIIKGIEEFANIKFDPERSLTVQLTELAHAVSAMYNDTDSPYLARINNWAMNPAHFSWKKEWFDEIVYLPFENMMLPCPKMYHEVLEASMGKDYMTPIKDLGSHEYPCYKRFERELMDVFKACNCEPLPFLFE